MTSENVTQSWERQRAHLDWVIEEARRKQVALMRQEATAYQPVPPSRLATYFRTLWRALRGDDPYEDS